MRGVDDRHGDVARGLSNTMLLRQHVYNTHALLKQDRTSVADLCDNLRYPKAPHQCLTGRMVELLSYWVRCRGLGFSCWGFTVVPQG